MSPLLSIKNLNVNFDTPDGEVNAVNNLNFDLHKGETLAIVGESGSGKSQTAFSILGLLSKNGKSSGSILFNNLNLLSLNEKEMNQVRAQKIGIIFQDPMTSLNPYLRVSDQLAEVLVVHKNNSRNDALNESIKMLEAVNIPNAKNRIHMFPHEFSGGQRQRLMIAMSLALSPKILIADEPTTALDVTTEAQILNLVKDMQKQYNSGVLFITHDFGVVAEIADRVVVMHEGSAVETGSVEQVLNKPKHPYTRSLIAAVPSLNPRKARSTSKEKILEVKNLSKSFGVQNSFFGFRKVNLVVNAVNNVSIELFSGETLGIVGESGSGKSTLARCLIKLLNSDSGKIFLGDVELTSLNRNEMRPLRTKIQMIFQDPLASLNPRLNIEQTIAEPLKTHFPNLSNNDIREKVISAMNRVGLKPNLINRYPHEFSGGQCQRVGIARALITEPKLIICDEPVSSLDVSIQAQILELLDEIRKQMKLSLLFITHDLRVAAQVCDRIAVMQYGNLLETGKTIDVFKNPKHDYTKSLLSAVPGKKWKKESSYAF